MTLWIFFKSAILGVLFDPEPVGEGEMSPHYYQVGIEMQVPHLASANPTGSKG